MKTKTISIALLMGLLVLSGCATHGKGWYSDWRNCAISGGVAGAAIGSIDDKDAAVEAGVGGAVLMAAICAATGHGKDMPEPDSDGDGVSDNNDRCPSTPKGMRVGLDGCSLDSDGDGVVDTNDRCLGTAKGVKVDATGCVDDADGDGVSNKDDLCPNTPRGTAVAASGCAKVLSKKLVLEGVRFNTNSAELAAESKQILDVMAVRLQESNASVEVGGHTDSLGDAGYNMRLSQKRADAVRNYLISKGVSASKVSARGYGEEVPAADNGTAMGRKANRRVELTKRSK